MVSNPADEQQLHNLSQACATLESLLPAGILIAEASSRAVYDCDGFTARKALPGLVVLPETSDQLQIILRTARRFSVPVTVRGAGTGLSGGATPCPYGILLVMTRFSRIISIDPLARIAHVEPGVRNISVSEAAAPHGLFYAPDPSSQIACTIGGNVAENAGGVHTLKYGLTFHNVLMVRGLTMEGETLTLGSLAPDTPGPDLLPLVIGSEGLLMIMTDIWLRLLPKPEYAQCMLASFASVEQAAMAVASIIASGPVPAGLEMMDQAMIRATEDFVHAGYDVNAAALLLCEADGSREDVEEDMTIIRQLMMDAGAGHIMLSQSEAQRLQFWKGRKNAFPACGRLSPDYFCMDGSIPRYRLPEVLAAIAARSAEYGLRCLNVFHAGDGNLHPLILFDAASPEESGKAEALGLDILRICVDLGGSVTGEHGVGIEKLDAMCHQFPEQTLRFFFSVKDAFDPYGLLNPGKAIPTTTHCAELGGMHVHHGDLPFTELSRF